MDKVYRYIDKHQLFDSGHKLLVGLSGGMDSVVLLHLLLQSGYHCEVAHVNFKLRGQASDNDAGFCRRLCLEMGVVFHSLEQDALAYASQHNVSVEMAARDIRYNWFERIRLEHNLDFIAVAHHKNDQAETILMNLIRGTGVTGMRGMLSKNGHIVRPLLVVTHEEVEQYARLNALNFCTDETNADTVYHRNKIRHHLLPEIIALNPAFVENIGETAMRFAESATIIDAYVAGWRKHMADPSRIPIEQLMESGSPLTLLNGVLSEYGFSPGMVADIFNSYPYRTGAGFSSETHNLLVDRNYLVIEPRSAAHPFLDRVEVYPENRSGLNLYFEVVPAESIRSIPTEPNIACLDLDRLVLPLAVRSWQQGDKFRPLGMKGFKKVSDFLIDEKVSLTDKASVKLLLSGDQIVWLPGYRIDDRYKITSQTARVLWMEWLAPE